MAVGDTARLYHRLSSYEYAPGTPWDAVPIDHPLLVRDFVSLDMDRVPPPWKEYPPELPRVELPRGWTGVPASATDVLAGTFRPPSAAIDRAGLARLLHLSAGVVRTSFRAGRRWTFRAAGSAGGRFPLEVYVSARGVDGIPDGVHWYDPGNHALVQIGGAARPGATTLVVTGIPWRTGWKYAERGLRHIYWDGGTMLAQTLALGESAGYAPRLWTRFPDADVATLVGADRVQEFPIALVSLGEGQPAIEPVGSAVMGTIAAAIVEFPLVTLAQRAGEQDRLGHPWPHSPALPAGSPDSDTLDTVILRRGSTRSFDPDGSVPRDLFEWSLAASLRGSRMPHFIAVHRVVGLEPGLYRWPDLARPVRRGDLREDLLRLCWDQNLGRDAAFVVIGAVDLGEIDDCGYREAQVDSGIVEGRLHLAAYALRVGASGMTFLDAELAGVLGEPLAGLLLTCVGVPAYESKPGGRPGDPVSVVIPTGGETLREPYPATRR